MATGAAIRASGLRIFDGWSADTDPRHPAARGAVPDALAARAGGGFPRTLRVNGWPIELRIWEDRPGRSPDAWLHPSGLWVALRAL